MNTTDYKKLYKEERKLRVIAQNGRFQAEQNLLKMREKIARIEDDMRKAGIAVSGDSAKNAPKSSGGVSSVGVGVEAS